MGVATYRRTVEGPEKGLEKILISSIPQILGAGHSHWWGAASLTIGASRPDLLIVAYEPRIRALVGASRRDVEIISYLFGVRWARPATIAARLGRPEADVAVGVASLAESRVLRKYATAYSLSRGWRAVLPKVISVEAKVKNWRRAIQQAKLNLAFSHESYIALPDVVANRIQSTPEFRRSPLGLIALRESRTALLREAPTGSPTVPSYYFKLAALIADATGGGDGI